MVARGSDGLAPGFGAQVGDYFRLAATTVRVLSHKSHPLLAAITRVGFPLLEMADGYCFRLVQAAPAIVTKHFSGLLPQIGYLQSPRLLIAVQPSWHRQPAKLLPLLNV